MAGEGVVVDDVEVSALLLANRRLTLVSCYFFLHQPESSCTV
jgi:hypothetical protein